MNERKPVLDYGKSKRLLRIKWWEVLIILVSAAVFGTYLALHPMPVP